MISAAQRHGDYRTLPATAESPPHVRRRNAGPDAGMRPSEASRPAAPRRDQEGQPAGTPKTARRPGRPAATKAQARTTRRRPQRARQVRPDRRLQEGT